MWFPLRKAEEEVEHGERRRVLYSLISAEVKDGAGDTVRQGGMDTEPLIKDGYVLAHLCGNV